MDIASLIHGGPLPERLDVPPHLQRQFDRLWQRSVASQTEWGMTLTVDRVGRVHGRHACGGTTGGFGPDLRVGRGERLLGLFHTHPYVGDVADTGFSDRDFAWLIAHPAMMLLLAQSGDTVFGLARTPRTVVHVPDGFVGYSGRYYERLVEVYSAVDIPYEEAVWQTNCFFAEAFRLGLYRGQSGHPLETEFRP